MKVNKLFWIGLSLVIIASFAAVPSQAQMVVENSLDQITDQYQSIASSQWAGPLKGFAMRIFWGFAAINFAWTIAQRFVTKSLLSDLMADILKQIVFIGFFYALLLNYTDWAKAIVDSFRMAGNVASGHEGLTPTNILDSALNIVTTCFSTFSLDLNRWDDDLVILACGVIMLIAFALMAALQIVALVESYFFIYGGILFMGFGASQFTKDISLRVLFAVVGVGTKLFVLELVIGLAEEMIREWSAQVQATGGHVEIGDMLTMLACSVVLLAVAKIIPEIAQGIINGAAYNSGQSLVSSGVAAAQLGLASVAAVGAVGAAGIAAGAGLAGSGGVAAASLGAAGKLAQASGMHTEDAFRHAMGTDMGRISHYPTMFSSDQQKSASNVEPLFRNGEYEKTPPPESPGEPPKEQNAIQT